MLQLLGHSNLLSFLSFLNKNKWREVAPKLQVIIPPSQQISQTECCLISEGSFEATDISNYFTAFFPSKKVLVVNVVHLKMLLDLKKTSLKSR